MIISQILIVSYDNQSWMYRLTLGRVTDKKWKFGCEHHCLLWTFSLLNAITKPRSDKYDRSICLWATTSHHKIPVQGEKVTYTSAESEREREEGGCLLNVQRRPLTPRLENGEGICIVKGLRGERWGTLTSSLWAQESHINCSAGRLPSLSMGFTCAVPGEIPQAWFEQLNTYLSYCSLKVSAESVEKRWRLMYLKAAPDPVCQNSSVVTSVMG